METVNEEEIKSTGFTPINVKKLAKRISPTLSKLIPTFIYRRFEKILHIKELNEFFTLHSSDDAQTFLDAVVERLDLKINFRGTGINRVESLAGESVMFVSNHPYGGPEAMLLFSYLHRLFPDCRLVAQSFLKFLKPLEKSCVYNKKDVRTLYNAVQNRTSLLLYPAGYCSRMLSFGEVFDYDWKPSFVKIAKKNNMPIVVFHTDGELSRRMHRWTKFRSIFNIKTSIETMFLVDEMFKLSGNTISIETGSIIDPGKLDGSIPDSEWASRIREYSYNLGKNPELEFDYKKAATLPER